MGPVGLAPDLLRAEREVHRHGLAVVHHGADAGQCGGRRRQQRMQPDKGRDDAVHAQQVDHRPAGTQPEAGVIRAGVADRSGIAVRGHRVAHVGIRHRAQNEGKQQQPAAVVVPERGRCATGQSGVQPHILGQVVDVVLDVIQRVGPPDVTRAE